MEETLSEKETARTPTAYYAALFNVLERQIEEAASSMAAGNGASYDDEDGDEEEEDDDERLQLPRGGDDDQMEALTATALLLSTVVSKVPAAVLRARFAESCSAILSCLARCQKSTSATRSLLDLLGSVLVAQERETWSHSSTGVVFQQLLAFTLDHRPKIRNKAQQITQQLLTQEDSQLMARKIVSKFILHELENNSPQTKTGQARLVHVVTFAPKVLGELPQQEKHAMALFNVAGSGQPNLVRHVFESLAIICKSASRFSASNAKRLMEVTLQVKPNKNDTNSVVPWLKCVAAASLLLADLDSVLYMQKMPDIVSALAEYLTTDVSTVADGVVAAFRDLTDSITAEAVQAAVASPSAPLNRVIQALVQTGLSFSTQSNWSQVFKIFKHLLSALGESSAKLASPCIVRIDEFARATNDATLRDAAESVIKEACRQIGPEALLTLLPLNILPEQIQAGAVSRPWLLHLIHDAIPAGSSLVWFATSLGPLITELERAAVTMNAQGQATAAMQYRVLSLQVWALLPGFCTRPSDLSDGFKMVAKEMGRAISSDPEASVHVCRALMNLTSDIDPEYLLHVKSIMSSFAKNFLPLLFNAHAAADSPVSRRCYVDGVKAYASATEPLLLISYYKGVMKKILESQDGPTRAALLELVEAMTPSVDNNGAMMLYKTIMPYLKDADTMVQKRAYKCLEALVTSHEAALPGGAPALFESLMNVDLASAATAKKERMHTIEAIASMLDDDQFIVRMPMAIAEVLLSTKEVNEKSRHAAFDVLLEWALRMESLESTTDFFNMILAGLAAETPHMMSATVSALARLVYEQRGTKWPVFCTYSNDPCDSHALARVAADASSVGPVAAPVKEPRGRQGVARLCQGRRCRASAGAPRPAHPRHCATLFSLPPFADAARRLRPSCCGPTSTATALSSR